jgi:hypothetical protein
MKAALNTQWRKSVSGTYFRVMVSDGTYCANGILLEMKILDRGADWLVQTPNGHQKAVRKSLPMSHVKATATRFAREHGWRVKK